MLHERASISCVTGAKKRKKKRKKPEAVENICPYIYSLEFRDYAENAESLGCVCARAVWNFAEPALMPRTRSAAQERKIV